MARLKIEKANGYNSTFNKSTLFSGGVSTAFTSEWRTGNEYLGAPQLDVVHEFAWNVARYRCPRVSIVRSDGWSTDSLGSQVPLFVQSQSEFDLAYNDALSDLNEQVRGSLDLSIDSFQLGQTASLGRYVTKAVNEAAEFYRGIRKSPIREISSRYLEWVYGVKPTLASIYGIYDKIYGSPGVPLRVKARSSRSSNTSGTMSFFPYGLSGSWANIPYQGVLSTRAEIALELKTQKLSSVQKLAGWTSINPLSVIYELTPYSFVADWFFDLGGYIRNFESYLVYNSLFSKGWYTWTAKSEVTATSCVVTTPGGTLRGFSPGSTDFRYKWRRPLSSYPLPRRPRLTCDLGSGRLLNAAALLGNLLPRR